MDKNRIYTAYFVSDGEITREATITDMLEFVRVKNWRPGNHNEYIELENGVWLRSWGDGRYTEEGNDRISYGRVYAYDRHKNELPTIGFVRLS